MPVVQVATTELLKFELGRQLFGIPLRDVSEVVRAVSVAPLPKAPPIIEGVINLRGTIIPVLDIRARFKLPPKGIGPSDHLVVARAKDRVVAVRVDRALEIGRAHV